MAREKAIAAETRSSYGSRRMAKQLQDEGLPVGRHKVRRLMRQAAVTVARLKKRQPVSIDSWQASQVAPNLLARQFDVAQPDTVWVGDMTYVWTAEGWEYLAVWAVAFLWNTTNSKQPLCLYSSFYLCVSVAFRSTSMARRSPTACKSFSKLVSSGFPCSERVR